MLIFLFFWNDSTNTTTRVSHVAIISWDNVNMAVHYGLSSILATVSTNVITSGMEFLIKYHLDYAYGYSQATKLYHIKTKERLHMSLGYQEDVTP